MELTTWILRKVKVLIPITLHINCKGECLPTLSPNWCIMCKKANESQNHLFIHYGQATKFWNMLFSPFDGLVLLISRWPTTSSLPFPLIIRSKTRQKCFGSTVFVFSGQCTLCYSFLSRLSKTFCNYSTKDILANWRACLWGWLSSPFFSIIHRYMCKILQNKNIIAIFL